MSIIHHHADSEELLFNKASDELLALLRSTCLRKNYFDLALSGGSTAKKYFRVLLGKLKNNADVLKIRFFFSDERATSLEHDESNAGNAYRLLLKPLDLNDNFFPMFDETMSAKKNAERYEAVLYKHLKGEEIPQFDLVYLGIGTDGHIASLFPNSDLIKKAPFDSHLVQTYKHQDLLLERITLMPKIINGARFVHVLAPGKEKSGVIDRILHGPLIPEKLPAQMVLRNEKTHVTLFT